MKTYTSRRKPLQVCPTKLMLTLAAVIAVFLICLPSSGQVSLGRILGNITDQSGGAVASATVTVIDVARGVTRPLVADSAGVYVAPALTPGTYTVRAEVAGFKVTERQNILVSVGQDTRVDLELQPGEQQEIVTVTEEALVINTTNSELSGTVDQQQIEQLPIAGRQFFHLLDFQPGVLAIPGGDSIGYVSNGGRQSTTVWMLDGVDETEQWSGTGPVAGQRQASILPVDAIQGADVIANPGAQYGWREGSVVNVGIKSGTNSIHGTSWFFDRTTALDARNPFLAAGVPKQKDKIEDFGVSIGGPIKKDKLFYFGSYEGEYFKVGNPGQVTEPTTLSGAGTANSIPDAIADLNLHGVALSPLSLRLAGCDPSSASIASKTGATVAGACNAAKGVFGSFPLTTLQTLSLLDAGHSHNVVGKIDYHPTAKHALNGEYFYGNGFEYSPASVQPYFADNSPQLSEVGRAVWIWTPRATLVNEARFGNDINGGPVNPAECTLNLGQPDYAAAFGYTPGTPGIVPGCKAFAPITIGSFTTLGSGNGTTSYITHYVGLDTVSWIRGKHAFKFGGEAHFIHFHGQGKIQGLMGTTDFGNVFNVSLPGIGGGAATTGTALESFLNGDVDQGTLLIGIHELDINQQRYALFAQDDWRITPRLMINLGLRWERVTPITDEGHQLGNFDPTTSSGLVQETDGHPLYHNAPWPFGPRVGMAWDVTGRGTTVVRAGFTMVAESIINYNNLIRQTFGAALNQIPTGSDLTRSDGTIVAPKPGDIAISNVTLTPAQLTWLPNTPIFNTAGQKLACGSAQPGNPSSCNLNAINPNLPASYFSTWTVSVTHAFTHNLALNVAYVGTHGSNMNGVIDVNQPTLGVKGTAAEQLRRPYYSKFPYLGQIRTFTDNLTSNYNALQVYLTKRTSRGLTFNAGYTWSHALDQNSSTSSFNAFDNTDPIQNYGNSANDVRHRFSLSGTYDIPGKKMPGQLLEGWRVSSTLNILGRFPFNALDSSNDLSGTGEKADRWNLIGNASDFNATAGYLVNLPCFGVIGSKFASSGACTVVGTVKGSAGNVLLMPQICQTAAAAEPINSSVPASNALATGTLALGGGNTSQVGSELGCYMAGNSAIIPPAQGTFGTMAKNLLRRSPFSEWDFNVTKSIRITEGNTVEVRAEFYNVLNSVQYGAPGSNPNNPVTFGAAQGTISSSGTVTRSGAPRNILLGLKWIF